MHWRTLTAAAISAAIAGFVVGSTAMSAASQASTSLPVVSADGLHGRTGSVARSPRPDKADWATIQTAAGLRRLALAPNRTARFRAFAASLGLRGLVSIHPLAPGPCLTAVIDLYNNLRDLKNAQPGEKWGPLRRAVAKEPSIDACAPRPSKQDGARLIISDPPSHRSQGSTRGRAALASTPATYANSVSYT
jgi:hypothetical protein